MTGILVALITLFSGQSSGISSAIPTQPRRPPTPTLTLRQLVGQRMVFAYSGLTPPPELRSHIARGEAAGVIVFSRNVSSAEQLRATVGELQAIRRPRGLRAPLIVMTDQERGPVRRLPGSPPVARAAGGGASARADGLATARTLRAGGVNLDLAPVADVGRPGAALVREKRTHGSSAGSVADGVLGFVAGLRAGHVGATAKHFPGLGASPVNTDAAPARINLPLATLRAVDEAPFRSLIEADVDAVMLATAVYPALDDRPAALSRAWIGDELRDRLGFRGVTISDDLGTPAVSAYGPIARRAVVAARAGIDLPLFVGDYAVGARAADGLVAAARRGELGRRELGVVARRVLRLRRGLAR